MEIDRYDLVSTRAKFALFKRGALYVDLKAFGKMLDLTDC